MRTLIFHLHIQAHGQARGRGVSRSSVWYLNEALMFLILVVSSTVPICEVAEAMEELTVVHQPPGPVDRRQIGTVSSNAMLQEKVYQFGLTVIVSKKAVQ